MHAKIALGQRSVQLNRLTSRKDSIHIITQETIVKTPFNHFVLASVKILGILAMCKKQKKKKRVF